MMIKRDLDLERELGKHFEMAYKGQIPLLDLMSKAENVQCRAMQKDPEGFDSKLCYLLLKDALSFAGDLHDPATREGAQAHPEILQAYRDALFGKSRKEYEVPLEESLLLRIIYLPFKEP